MAPPSPSVDYNGKISPNEMAENLQAFITSLGCNLHQLPHSNSKLQEEATNILDTLSASEKDRKHLLHILPNSCHLANQAFGASPFEMRALIALYTALVVYVDDAPDDIQPALETFAKRFGQGLSHADSKLDLLVHIITIDMPRYCGPVAQAGIIKGTTDFILGCLLERSFPDGFQSLPRQFPTWLRRKTGLGEVYAYLVFPHATFPENQFLKIYLQAIPLLAQVIDVGNDIMSYYKESVVGDESNTLISNIALARGCDQATVLKDICRELIACNDYVKDLLVSQKATALLEVFNSFVNGVLVWHIDFPRYKLGEIGLTTSKYIYPKVVD